MTDHKQNPYHYKGDGNQEHDLKAQPEGLVHPIIVCKDYRGEYNPDNAKDQASDELPFPGNKQDGE